jgi:hypothetical protein
LVGSTAITAALDEGMVRRLSPVVTRPTTPGPRPAGDVGVRVPVLVGVLVGGVPVGVEVGRSAPRERTGSPDLPPETPAPDWERTPLPSSQFRAALTDAPGLAA